MVVRTLMLRAVHKTGDTVTDIASLPDSTFEYEDERIENWRGHLTWWLGH